MWNLSRRVSSCYKFDCRFTKREEKNDGTFIRTFDIEFQSRGMLELFMEKVNIRLCRQCHYLRCVLPSTLDVAVNMWSTGGLYRNLAAFYVVAFKFEITDSLLIQILAGIHGRMRTCRWDIRRWIFESEIPMGRTLQNI